MVVPNCGDASGYAVKNEKDLIAAGAWDHDAKHYHFYVPEDAVADRPADATLIREPIKAKSDDWQETAHHWLVNIKGQTFDYYTGLAHRTARKFGDYQETYDKLKNKNLTQEGFQKLLAVSKATPPKLDDVLYSLVSDADACEMSFNKWCSNFGYNTDSRKAFATYEACQNNADKLRLAGINIAAERERLADY